MVNVFGEWGKWVRSVGGKVELCGGCIRTLKRIFGRAGLGGLGEKVVGRRACETHTPL